MTVKYENLVSSPKQVVKNVMQHLSLSVDDETVSHIHNKYKKENITGEDVKNHLHLNVAKVNRYRTEMSNEFQTRVQDELREFICEYDYMVDQ